MAQHQAKNYKVVVFDVNMSNNWSKIHPNSLVNVYRDSFYPEDTMMYKVILIDKPDIVYMDSFRPDSTKFKVQKTVSNLKHMARYYNILLILVSKVSTSKDRILSTYKDFSTNIWYISQKSETGEININKDKFYVKQLFAKYWNPFSFIIDRKELING